LILNPWTGNVTPQYHVVYDDLFTTVPNAETGGLFDPNDFDVNSWNRLVESGCERYIFDEEDENGRPIPLPKLDDEWIDEEERAIRDCERQRQPQCSER
jgi:hypothetical protein